MSSFADAVQVVLTKGLDAAQTVALAKLQVNDPTPYVTGPNGTRVPVGQRGGVAGALAAVPPVAWVAIIGLVGAVILVPLFRKR